MRRLTRNRLSTSILQALADEIRHNQLQVGDRLPPEREIAQRLGVSRPLVREALGQWAALGIVETINGRGTFLRAPVSATTRHVIVSLAAERQQLLHTLELRRALETEAAALAAERATPAQVDELEELLRKVEQAYERYGDAPEEDWAFHQAVYRASGNPLFGQLIGAILELFHRFWENPLNRPDFARRGLVYHHSLVAAIRARDPRAAREAVLNILRVLQEDLAS